MDYTAEELEDLATMRTLRERMRAVALAKIAECEAMDPAKNWLDMNRQIKAIMSADKMVVALYSPPPRRHANKHKPISPYPSHFKNGTPTPAAEVSDPSLLPCAAGEVAYTGYRRRSRAPSPAKSVTEGANGVENTSPSPADDTLLLASEVEEDAFFAEATAKARATVEAIAYPCAQAHKIWPDGAPFDASETAWEHHTRSDTVGLPPEDVPGEIWLGKEVLTRVNAVAKHYGRKTGRHLDGQPYQGGGSFALSVNFGAGINRPAANETPARSGLPWWIIRKPQP